MSKYIKIAALIILVAIPNMLFSITSMSNAFLTINVDEATYAFVIGTSTVANGKLLYGYPDPGLISGPWSTHTVIKIDKTPVDMRTFVPTPVSIPAPKLTTGTNFITGTITINGIDVTARWELVNNPATGTPQDTAKIKYTLKNNTLATHKVALRLELDTQVINNDGTNISIDNGLSVILANTVYKKSLNQLSANWWDYDQSPLTGTPTLVGRGYNKNNIYDEPAVEPDMMEIANWEEVKADGQWSLAPAGVTIPPGPVPVATPDSAVVLWWCNGDENSDGFTVNPGESITFLTYYGLNQEQLLTTPTSTRTNTPTFTLTRTVTNTLTYTCTATASPTHTITQTHTITNTYTNSPTMTITNTFTETFTNTITNTVTNTYTITNTYTLTNTFTVTNTYTVTNTFTMTSTHTVTNTVTETFTVTNTYTATVTYTSTPLPLILDLKGNFPNPFIDDTQIVYKLSVDADVKVTIFDVSGEVVRREKNIVGRAGYNSFYWDGKNRAAKPVASGVFIYRIDAYTNRGEHAFGLSKAACVK